MRAAESSVKPRSAVAVAALACACAAFAPDAPAQGSEPNLHTPGEIRYVKQRLLVQPRAGLSMQEFDKKLRVHGGRRVGAIPRINVHIIELPSQASEQAVARMLNSDRHIKFAELDQQLAPALTPNDPAYTRGWHLPKIGSPSAWDQSVGEGVTIAILDTGVDPTHPDLAPNLVRGYNVYDNNTDTRDVHGHGTAVAGAAAMAGNNMVGGTGVAFKSRIMPVRIADASAYGYYSTMAKGLAWAADNGAKVANLSYWGVCNSSTILSAAQYFRNKGGVVTGAAGNSGDSESWIESDNITCVAATGSTDSRASFSTYGDFVDVAAPGVSIYTTTNGSGYSSVSGTSAAAPVAAAVYALMVSVNRSLTPGQLDETLFSTALDLGSGGKDAYYGYGRVDAAAAVAKARGTSTRDATAPDVSITSPTAGYDVDGIVAVDVSASDDVGVTRVELYADGNLIGTDTTEPYGFSWDTTALASGQATVEARAFDAAGNVARDEITVNVGSSDSSPPSVAILNPRSGAVVSSAITVSANATDDTKVAKVTLSINGKEVAASYGSSLSYVWDPYTSKGNGRGKGNKQGSGSYTLTATATDDSGNSKGTSVSVTVP